jgi:hypothetical protein
MATVGWRAQFQAYAGPAHEKATSTASITADVPHLAYRRGKSICLNSSHSVSTQMACAPSQASYGSFTTDTDDSRLALAYGAASHAIAQGMAACKGQRSSVCMHFAALSSLYCYCCGSMCVE